jgi:diguanylate cyclase (GGDEF)-like protein
MVSALVIASILAPVFLYPLIHNAARLRDATVEIGRLAKEDALTGLPNLFALRERLAEIGDTPGGSGFAVLFVDLDRFKLVNDTLGHALGDALLTAAAGRLSGLLRHSDHVARFGGDEFVVLQQPVASADETSALAARIVEELSKPYRIDGHEIAIGASIGIAVAPLDGSDAGQLLANADMALYAAKAVGKGTWRFFETGMAAAAQARRNTEIDLRAALARNEFEVYFQPIVDLATGRITTCEALLRWRHGSGRIVAPAEFVPIAEEMGIIDEIGAWVLRESCAACARWPGEIRVAVNFSSVQFQLCNVPAMVADALATTGLPAGRLEIEITESLLMHDFPATRRTIEQLRATGVRVALDDFGTGFSGLNYLHSFPLDKVKIDRTFLVGLPQDERSLTLIRGVARLSAALGLTVTAEGVETEDQLEAVASEICVHEAQGHLFCRPLPEHHLRELLAAGAIANVGRNERGASKPRLYVA